MPDLIYKDECYKVYGICYEIQNKVGSALTEKQYQNIFESKLKKINVPHEREKDLYFIIDEEKIAGNIVDFVIFDKIAIDLKTKNYISREDFRQMSRYLKAGNYKLGLLINFRGEKVVIKRVINSSISI